MRVSISFHINTVSFLASVFCLLLFLHGCVKNVIPCRGKEFDAMPYIEKVLNFVVTFSKKILRNNSELILLLTK